MALDTPATIAIIGAGPIGLEAAMYARFLGYKVLLFERARVAERIVSLGTAPLAAAFAEYRSPLGLAALHAQDESFTPPGDGDLLTAAEWLDAYLLPLSRSDLVADALRLQTRVISVAVNKRNDSEESNKGDASSAVETEDAVEEADELEEVDIEFEVQVQTADTEPTCVKVDAVLDASGSGTVRWERFGLDKRSRRIEPGSGEWASLGVLSPADHCYILSRRSLLDATAESAGSAEVPRDVAISPAPEIGPDGLDFSRGLEQIRAVFADLVGRRDLDLYATIQI